MILYDTYSFQAITGGRVLDHQLYSTQVFTEMRARTRELWEKVYPHVPFDFRSVNTYKEGNAPESTRGLEVVWTKRGKNLDLTWMKRK